MNNLTNIAPPKLDKKKTYQTPELESHRNWVISTGVTTPLTSTGLGDFLEESQ
jgi:hypothetical protein